MFDEPRSPPSSGTSAIGHVRYSTTGSNTWENAQPVTGPRRRPVALGHNGNLTNTDALREQICQRSPAAAGDDRLRADRRAARVPRARLDGRDLERALERSCRRLVGAFSAVALSEERSWSPFRDAHGVRPLVLGKLEGGYCVASETCALDQIGASLVREVRPGEAVPRRHRCREPHALTPRPAMCVFEHIYFARPDSLL